MARGAKASDRCTSTIAFSTSRNAYGAIAVARGACRSARSASRRARYLAGPLRGQGSRRCQRNHHQQETIHSHRSSSVFRVH